MGAGRAWELNAVRELVGGGGRGGLAMWSDFLRQVCEGWWGRSQQQFRPG